MIYSNCWDLSSVVFAPTADFRPHIGVHQALIGMFPLVWIVCDEVWGDGLISPFTWCDKRKGRMARDAQAREREKYKKMKGKLRFIRR